MLTLEPTSRRVGFAAVLAFGIGVALGGWAFAGVRIGKIDPSKSTSDMVTRMNRGALERLRHRGIVLTQEELQRTLELSERERKGEYLLMLDRPLSRKAHEQTRIEMTAKLYEKEGAEYNTTFRQ